MILFNLIYFLQNLSILDIPNPLLNLDRCDPRELASFWYMFYKLQLCLKSSSFSEDSRAGFACCS